MLRERWAADGDERAHGGQGASQGVRGLFTLVLPPWKCELGVPLAFSVSPKMASGERHTPCHDVIQGTCRIRRSGPSN
ncbi:hypothetical protein COCC4DRAFT_152034 [Bipolaris maydis ATCC 48331]|uniref:Uncharacterized protein n=2 Tax=Cochliobolus heterostrophus TaxID=5016 RepID=M2U5G5_COCH5|nr:uncharacterized protein COCC4DRAFT_152034 [Bipolaris maydis ATCC 48331]EMD93779.1 hypothetical protein COCHEDRAFT_1095035 [Bipolaris maydis C5]ENH99927.1 hypothetical protein COCC4DRAFT_152034 [Bipolaris maydis ATCC 48331]KAJ6203555.1 hypothetical protein PSV09DRAFT_1095035 [Bipolaris maydis]